MPSSPLARDNTAVIPLRLKKKDSFSTSHHTHGLGGEAKDAMLRPGLRVRRTNSSLRVIATKGNATLTAAIHHKVFVPELEIFQKEYARKEYEFAESIPSAMCPFQFIQNDTSDIVPFQRKDSNDDDLKSETDPQKMGEWLKDMRLKVHMRLVQRQLSNTTNPLEGHKLDLDKTGTISPRGQETSKKRGLDTDRKRGDSDKKKGGADTDRKSGQDTDRKKKDKTDAYDAIEDTPAPGEGKLSTSSSAPGMLSKEKLTDPPPIPLVDTPSRKPTRPNKLPQLSKPPSQHPPPPYHPMDADTPLFQSRKNPSLTRRTHSEYDVRRVRIKARNSVGLEPW